MSTKDKATALSAERDEQPVAGATTTTLSTAPQITSETVPTVKRRIVRNLQKHSVDAPLSVHGVFYIPLDAAIAIVSEGLALED